MRCIEILKSTKTNTLEYFELPDSELYKTYGEGKWTVKEILCHIADSETVLYDRIRRIIAESKQVLWAYDQDLWCDNLNYKNFPIDLQKNIFESVRVSIIYLAENNYESLGEKEFIHSETDLRTLRDEFDKVGLHCEHHLNQIETALGGNKFQ